MQLFTQGQWWSNVYNKNPNKNDCKHLIWAYNKINICYLPLCNDCIRNSVNSVAGDRIYKSHTISSWRWCHWFRHFYKVVHEIPPPGPHLAMLFVYVCVELREWLQSRGKIKIKMLSKCHCIEMYLLVWHRGPWMSLMRNWPKRKMWWHPDMPVPMDGFSNSIGSCNEMEMTRT